MTSDQLLYFDCNATTPVCPEVLEIVRELLETAWGNPSSSHEVGRFARARLEEGREKVAAFLGAQPDEIVFTSGGTEANNLAIFGVLGGSDRRRLVTSVVEHPATARPCARWRQQGGEVVELPVDPQGRVDLAVAESKLGRETALLTVMHANNETGTLQPIAELAELARRHGVKVHSDAAQSAGKVPVQVDDLGVDLLSLAGHKLYAPKGIGALYVRRGVEIAPLLLGAGHESGRRPGTENVASAAGLGEACRIAGAQLKARAAIMRELRDDLWSRLQAAIPGLQRNGHPELSLPNTLNVCFPGVTGKQVLDAAPGLAASTGSACHSGGVSQPSPVLVAMQVDPQFALGAVRLSLGRSTTAAQVERAAEVLAKAWRSVGRV